MAMISCGGAVRPRDRSAPRRQGVPSEIRQSLPARGDFGTELASIPAEFSFGCDGRNRENITRFLVFVRFFA
jgi:hypothetical protein